MSRFGSFGLDKKKKSKDRGSVGAKWCPWADLPPCDANGYTGHNVDVGMSMCFTHFVICIDCATAAFDLVNLHKWRVGECFKCKNTDIPTYFMRDPKEHWDDVAICRECCELAIRVLTNNQSCQQENHN